MNNEINGHTLCTKGLDEQANMTRERFLSDTPANALGSILYCFGFGCVIHYRLERTGK